MERTKAGKVFLAGILLVVACTGGGAIHDVIDSAIDTAEASSASDCGEWEIACIFLDGKEGWEEGEEPMDRGPYAVPDGWEPFGVGVSHDVVLFRRCVDSR